MCRLLKIVVHCIYMRAILYSEAVIIQEQVKFSPFVLLTCSSAHRRPILSIAGLYQSKRRAYYKVKILLNSIKEGVETPPSLTIL